MCCKLSEVEARFGDIRFIHFGSELTSLPSSWQLFSTSRRRVHPGRGEDQIGNTRDLNAVREILALSSRFHTKN